MHQKKRNEDRRNTNWDEPFIANVTWRMKHKAPRLKLLIKLPNEWFERRSFKLQAERGDAAFKKILIAQRCPIGCFHPRRVSPRKTLSRLRVETCGLLGMANTVCVPSLLTID